MTYQYYDGSIKLHGDGNYEIGKLLKQYSGRGYTVATSEAGLIPFYSKWKAVDTWGLNDKWIAHNELITESYLELIKPEVISFHNIAPESGHSGWMVDWIEMNKILKHYAESNDYELAAIYGPEPGNAFFYFVKTDIPEKTNITEQIKKIDFIWYENGERVRNLAQ